MFIDAITCSVITMHLCKCTYMSSQIFKLKLSPTQKQSLWDIYIFEKAYQHNLKTSRKDILSTQSYLKNFTDQAIMPPSLMVGLCQKNTLMLVFLLGCLQVEELKGKNILGLVSLFFLAISGCLTVILKCPHLLSSHLCFSSVLLSCLLKGGVHGQLNLKR